MTATDVAAVAFFHVAPGGSSRPEMRTNAIERPSGEYAGALSSTQAGGIPPGGHGALRRRRPAPPARTVQREHVPSGNGHRRKAMREPSGDQSGASSTKPAGGCVTGRRRPPSGRTTKIACLRGW